MSTLKPFIVARIKRTGPIALADYMADCLLNPDHGYYATRDPLGAGGDFITAPEISQMFGELIGLALAQAWIDRGCPAPFTLAELGPGRATLMADILRATAGVPGFIAAARITLIEASPTLRAIQQEKLAAHAVTWADTVTALPDDAPLFLVANEFFDALPIRQYIRDGDGWRERQIGVENDALVFGLSAPQTVAPLSHRMEDTRDGDLVERCAPATAIMDEIALRIAKSGGGALILDYGDWRTLGDTFQAIRDHQPDDPLAHPGLADLTAHVDFEALALGAPTLAHSRLTPQGVFLERLGITQRANTLGARLSGTALQTHIAAHRRLTHPDEMGTLFKAIALTQPGSPAFPGFSE